MSTMALNIETSHLICMQIKWLVSIWNVIPSCDGLNELILNIFQYNNQEKLNVNPFIDYYPFPYNIETN